MKKCCMTQFINIKILDQCKRHKLYFVFLSMFSQNFYFVTTKPSKYGSLRNNPEKSDTLSLLIVRARSYHYSASASEETFEYTIRARC